MIFIDRDRVDQTGKKISPDNAWFAKAKTATDSAIANSGSQKFDDGIYAADNVRAALVELFHKKCAYCESPLPDPFDVEHFRPKGHIAENSDHPGYYWLAYTWTNLLPSCVPCNQKRKDKSIWGDLNTGTTGGKSTQFPLVDEDKRSMNPRENIASEDPLLLDPCIDDPEDSINYLINGGITGINIYGETTVQVCHLDRSNLRRERRDVILSTIDYLETIQEFKNEGKTRKLAVLEKFFEKQYLANRCRFAGLARFVAKHPDLFRM